MSIYVEKVAEGYAVKLPRELKPSFKIAFPNSKWDTRNKCWTVGAHSGTRLDQWVAEHVEVATELEVAQLELESAELSVKNLDSLRMEQERLRDWITKIRIDTAELEERIIQLQEGVKTIKAADLDLQAAELDKARAQLRRSNLLAELRASIDKIVDMAVVEEAISTLNRLHGKHLTKDEVKFNAAKERLQEQIEVLAKHGLHSKGLTELRDMDFKRPDRDNPDDVTMEDIYTITPLDLE